MAVAQVQTVDGEGIGSATVTLTSVGAGNLLILSRGQDQAMSVNPDGTWTLATSHAGGGQVPTQVWYKIATAGGTYSVTLTQSGASMHLILTEYSGADDTTPIESAATTYNSSATSWTTSSIAGTADGMRHAAFCDFGTFPAASGWSTVDWTDTTNSRRLVAFRKAIASTGSEAITITTAGTEGASISYVSIRPVPSDTTAPTVDTATIDAAGTGLTIVFDEAVTGDGTGFTIDVGSSLTATYVSGDGTNTLVFSLSGVVLDADTPTLDYDAGTGDMADLAANALATLADGAVTNNSTQVADATDPTLSTAVLSGATTLVLTFSEAVTLTDQTGMTVFASGGAVTISSVSGDGSSTLTLTLSRSIASTESLSFSFDSGTGDVEDLAGNALATISNRLVTNNVNNTPGSVSLIGSGLIQ